MAGSLVIPLAGLREVCERILDHLSELGYQQLEIPFDAYWHVAAQIAFDAEAKPTQLDLGSLEEDWDELERLLSGDRPGPFIPDLRPLAAILNAVSRVTWDLPRHGPRAPQ